MESPTKSNLTFKVTRQSPELIPPAKPTPQEFKSLSDIDNQEGLRFQVPIINFYPKNPSMAGTDPARVIRSAVARALVFYYPYAGRLRELSSRKLAVECTGEGVLFVEADADVTLAEFGDNLYPPFPSVDELLHDVPGSAGIIGCPLILIQVTRLNCGGFIMALRFSHTMSDGTGMAQFLSAVGELARGATTPSVPPVWERHLLSARNPPRVSHAHHEYDFINGTFLPHDDKQHRSFFFGTAEVSALLSRLPPQHRDCTTFDVITACMWRCYTVAISPKPDEMVRVMFGVNSRKRFDPPLPEGYYGNVVALPVAISSAGELSKKPLHCAVELVRKAKFEVTEEYMRSLADRMVVTGGAYVSPVRSFLVSDLTQMGFDEVDYGWGKPVYGGVAKGSISPTGRLQMFYLPFKNRENERGMVVPVGLPAEAMGVFAAELAKMVKRDASEYSIFSKSAL